MPQIRPIGVSGSIPSVNQLALGDIAINTYDGKAYIKKAIGNTQTILEIGGGSSVSSSYALSASYAANGGVTQLLAGTNISLSPSNGLGQVTITSTGGSGGTGNTATGSYGSFYDTTTQTNPVANIPRSMSFDTTAITNGVSISGSTSPFNTYIKTQNAGVYDIQFSAQLDKTDSGADEIVIWLRKNGSNLTDTATAVTLAGNNAKNVAAWNWFVNSAANDYYQIIWQSPDTDVRLLAEPADGHPGIPSVIATVNRVDQFLSNTGSFSGSFTGQLFGTSSWAVSASQAISSSFAFNATSASYAVSSSQATSASYAVSSSYALSSSYSVSSSYALSSSYGLSSSFASTASYVATASYVPTLTQVTTAGNTTTNAITVGGLTSTLANADVTHVGANAKGFYIRNSADSLVRAGLQFDGSTAYVELLGRYQNGAVFIRQDGANGNISFLRDGSEYLRIFGATGNTAIGTTTDAGYKLDVNGTGRFSGNLTITGSASNSLLVKGSGATSSTTAVLVQNSSNRNLLTIRDDGNVRIGAGSPSFTLDVSGSGRFTNNLTVTGSALVTGSLTVSGSTTILDNLTVNGNATLNGTAVVISPPSIQLPGLTGAYSPSPSVRTVMFDTLNNALFITSSLPGGGAGYTGTVTILGNPPGQQNLNYTNGILISVT